MIPEDPMFSSDFSPRSGIEEKIKTAIKLHDEGADAEKQRKEIGVLMMYYKQLLDGTYRPGLDKLTPDEAEAELMTITADPAYQIMFGEPEGPNSIPPEVMMMMDAVDQFMEQRFGREQSSFDMPTSSGDPLYDMLFNDDEGDELDLFMDNPMESGPDMLPPGLREAFGDAKFMKFPGMPGGFIIGRPIRIDGDKLDSLGSLFGMDAEPEEIIDIDVGEAKGNFKDAIENALREAISRSLNNRDRAPVMDSAHEAHSIFESFMKAAQGDKIDKTITSLAYKPAADVDGKPSVQVLLLVKESPSSDMQDKLKAAVTSAMEPYYTAPTISFTTEPGDVEDFCDDPGAGRIMKLSIVSRDNRDGQRPQDFDF